VGSWLCSFCSLHFRTLRDQISAARPAQTFRNDYGKFQTQLRWTAQNVRRRCIDSRNMSYHTKLLSILIFILLYSDYITFWLASSVSPLVLETGLEYGSSSELKGEYFVVFLAEELLYKYIYVY
jgi:hypothetical protein